MLNPASKTFSIRRLQGLCKNGQSGGISFVPPSAPRRTPTPPLRRSTPTTNDCNTSHRATSPFDMSNGFVNMASSAAASGTSSARVVANQTSRAAAGWAKETGVMF